MASIVSDREEPAKPAAKQEERQIDLSLTALDQSEMNMVMAMIDEDDPEDEQLPHQRRRLSRLWCRRR